MSRTGLLLAVVAFAASVLAVPSPPDVPEECRPKPPTPGKEKLNCCELPKPISVETGKFKDAFLECEKQVKATHPNAKPPHSGPPPNGPPKDGRPCPFMVYVTCLDECIYNKTGLLTGDMQLNEAAISETLGLEVESGSVWKPIVDKSIKTCLKNDGAKEEVEGCITGPHKFQKCVMREMYLNCPSGVWQDKEECNAEKQLMEKCPNLHGPPPHPPKKE